MAKSLPARLVSTRIPILKGGDDSEEREAFLVVAALAAPVRQNPDRNAVARRCANSDPHGHDDVAVGERVARLTGLHLTR